MAGRVLYGFLTTRNSPKRCMRFNSIFKTFNLCPGPLDTRQEMETEMFETANLGASSKFRHAGFHLTTKSFRLRINVVYVTVCAALAALGTGSESARAFCLDEAYQHAISNDPKFLQARAEYDAARQKFPQARAQMLPQVSAQFEWGRYGTHANLFGIDVSGNSTAAYGAAQLSQALFNMPYLYDMSRAKEFEESARQQLEVAKQELIMRVANACFDLLSAREKLQLADDEVDALTRLESDTRRMAQLGMKTIGDTAEIEARRSLAQSDEALARTDVEARRARYETLLGSAIDFTRWPRLAMHGTSPRIPAGDYQPQDNPSYQQAYRDLRVARLASKRINAEHLPTVDLFATYSRGLNPNLRGLTDKNDFHQSAVGLQVTIPIFSGGSVHYRKIEADHVATQYQNRLREVEQQLSTDHREMLAALQSIGTRIRALQQSLQAARLAYDSSMKAHQVGYSTTYETLNLRTDISNIRQKLFESYLDALKLQLKLKGILGTLDEQSLVAVDSFLASNAAPADRRSE
ncbi:TolC family protein [Burkholderia thailandensis]|uniref:TolC family protein n=1 Tax=Burkholderia thailandensis TaxID=57975 RepID=UPI001377CBDD|nr:TolC family protein [Burkholderia thailandensis]